MPRQRSLEDRIFETREKLRDLQDRKKLQEMRDRIRAKKRAPKRRKR